MNTKELRQKILDLAIHGKLVPQDPNDEPASVLLERIKAEKERLIKEGKIKRAKKSAKFSDTPHYENVPFEVPEGWVWTTVSDISKSILYGVSESAKPAGKYKLLRITDIQNNQVDWETVPFTDFDDNKVSSYILCNGDILFARTGATVGKSYLIKNLTQKAIYASYLIRVQTFNLIIPEYVKLFFESEYYWAQIELNSVGIGQPNVNGTILGSLNIPLPPLSEQKRIVIEIERWLSLINAIENNKVDLQTAIKQTKSKILDLAIHGKLVPQDPNEEPASELLKRINPKAEITCDNGHYPFVIPSIWIWHKIGTVAQVITGSTPSKSIPDYYGGSFPFYKPSDLDAGRHVVQSSEYLSEKGKSVSKIIPSNSIAICCIGSIGKIGYIEKEGTTNQQINTILPRKTILNPLYCYYVCSSSFFVSQLIDLSSAITISIVNKSRLQSTDIPLPPISEQQRIVAKIEELFSILDNIQKSLEA